MVNNNAPSKFSNIEGEILKEGDEYTQHHEK